jgi:uncharacterized protein (DUF305 family)
LGEFTVALHHGSAATVPCHPARIRVALAGVGLAWLLAACSGTAAPDGTAAPSSAGIVGQVCCVAAPVDGPAQVDGIDTVHNGWDIVLLNWMAPHDAVASQMAALAADRSTNDAVKQLAVAIDQDGQPRYLKLVAMANAWGQPIPSTDPAAASGHDHGGGPANVDSAAVLGPLTGADFDRQFLTIMMAHHQAALPVAQGAQANGENAQDKAMAQEISTTTTAEITKMQQILDQLPPAAVG